jgi:hypothetical protein
MSCLEHKDGYMKSTLGLPPTVHHTNVWSQYEYKILFLQKVNHKVDELVGEHVEIEDKEEIFDILKNTVQGREVTNDMIHEAIEYAAMILHGRSKMHTRLDTMREHNMAATLQPRGVCEREKGCLPMAAVKNSGSVYERYLQSQQKYRYS